MTSTEQVYALYVQANPVPDPDVLPLTQEGTELLDLERSPAMETQERIKIRPTGAAKRRRALAIGFAAIAIIAAATGAIVLLGGGDDEPVAAADAAPRVVFDGASCRYEGPTLIERGIVEFTIVNATSQRFDTAGWTILESRLAAELERFPLGTDTGNLDTMPDGTLFLNAGTEAGSESVVLRDLVPGTHLIDCLSYDGAESNHVWRAASTISVVAP